MNNHTKQEKQLLENLGISQTTTDIAMSQTPPLGARGALIYIAGKVTGEDHLECAAKFAKAKEEIEALGFQAVNPLEVVGTWDISWDAAMKLCIKSLCDCDAALFLPCTIASKGATLELEIVKALEMPFTGNPQQLKSLL